MAKTGSGQGGAIVNVSSGSALFGQPLLYGMTKSALNAMQSGLIDTMCEQALE